MREPAQASASPPHNDRSSEISLRHLGAAYITASVLAGLSHSLTFCHLRKIRETLNNLILKSPDEWQTSVALPFV